MSNTWLQKRRFLNVIFATAIFKSLVKVLERCKVHSERYKTFPVNNLSPEMPISQSSDVFSPVNKDRNVLIENLITNVEDLLHGPN